MTNREKGLVTRANWLCLCLLLAAFAAAASPAERSQQVEQWLSSASADPQTAEPALMDLLNAARRNPPEQADRLWLTRLVGYQSQLTRPGEHSPSERVAIYPIDVSARGLLNRLQRDQQRVQASLLLDHPRDFVEAWSGLSSDPMTQQCAGYLDAVGSASRKQRDALRETSSAELQRPRVADLAGALALLDGGDVALLRRALPLASKEQSLLWLQQLPSVFDAKATASVLEVAKTQPQLASAAQLQIASSGKVSNVQREQWIALLGDPRHGGSAALALARSMDSGLAQQLANKARSADGLERKRLLLALSQSSYKSASSVNELRTDAQFLAQLDEETRQWFAR